MSAGPDPTTPLHRVTFVVVDIETTGSAPAVDAITELGAVKLRGGECLGTFQTVVNPGVPIPPSIVYLTGITEAMVAPAPTIDSVLPAFLEFVGTDAVIVGHNVRFDLGFIRAAMRARGYAPLDLPFVDTCALARRLVRDEVPNCTLATLAGRFRLSTRPTHRALADALATGELLHQLLERAGTCGVHHLDDLLVLPTVKGHPQLNKLKLATALPRRPGVYLFRDAGGRTLYVGKAVDLRRRVRSYFAGDDRRKIGQLLRETVAIDHIETTGELEAAVLEVRLIHELAPRFNRHAKRWRRYAYVKLTLDERFPRLSAVRKPKAGDGCLYIGPLPSTASARLAIEAIETAAPLRRCTARIGARSTPRRAGECTPAQLGVSTCPCAGTVTESDYGRIVDRVVRGLTSEPELLLAPLEARMHGLARANRFEEAAATRDRASALASALARQRRLDALRAAGRITVEVEDGSTSVVDAGRLVSLCPPEPLGDVPGPLPVESYDEVAAIAGWLEARAGRYLLVDCAGPLAWPLPRLPRFEPAR